MAFVSSFVPSLSAVGGGRGTALSPRSVRRTGRCYRKRTGGGVSLVVQGRKSQARRSSSTTVTMGLLPLIPNWLLIAGYGYMAFRFARGYERTTYQQSYRILLAAVWPFLFALSGEYRKNFRRAIGAGDD